ncbi:hypothetical protein SHIRM173S_13303 [Streptomyces hirsutus]
MGGELLARLEEEYARVGAQAFGGSPTAAEVRERLQCNTPVAVERCRRDALGHRKAVARAEAAAPRRFGRLPAAACCGRQGCSGGAAGLVHAGRRGRVASGRLANTERATERSRVLAEATAFHEAVPGHHVQLSLAQELEPGCPGCGGSRGSTPTSRAGASTRNASPTMGLSSGPPARLGMLAMDSLRAARLVVDTGLHHFGWSRERAVGFLRAHTVLADVEIHNETDRYIEWPGQALSYMTGRLEIQRLRTRAARELGPGFDVRAFHDLVLGNGSLPLDVLDRVVARWTATR